MTCFLVVLLLLCTCVLTLASSRLVLPLVLLLTQIEQERMLVWDAEAHVSFLPETGALSLKSAAFADSGEYRCIVNGGAGDKKRLGIVRLHVQGKRATAAAQAPVKGNCCHD